MKKNQWGLALAASALIFTACNDAADDNTTTDSTAATETVTTSEGSYAAMADSLERNSQQGYYLDAKTGKPYTKLNVDRNSGQVTNEAGEPVWRYVDSRNWWVYGYDGSNWNQVGEARMENDKMMYKGDNDAWQDYDSKWKQEDDEWKMKTDNMKMKSGEDGEMKIKTDDTKLKVDEDGEMKYKTDNKTIKTDEDGSMKVKNN